jgi:hypothetical protein
MTAPIDNRPKRMDGTIVVDAQRPAELVGGEDHVGA